jgi:hypothetical protein
MPVKSKECLGASTPHSPRIGGAFLSPTTTCLAVYRPYTCEVRTHRWFDLIDGGLWQVGHGINGIAVDAHLEVEVVARA